MSLDLSYKKLKTLQGQDLQNVKYFDCSRNRLTYIRDLPEGLISLDCSFNMIVDIDLLAGK